MMINFRNKNAFTLAEVLITLSIIGVIAAMVIPGVIQDVQDVQHTAALKKVYSDLTQATILIQTSGIPMPATNDPFGVRDAFGKVMQFTKIDTALNIFGQVHASNTLNQYRNYKGTAPAYMHLSNNSPSAVLMNGTFIGFSSGYRDSRLHHEIYVDTNGKKGPNMFGFDLHKFFLEYKSGHYVLDSAGMPGAFFGGVCTAGSTSYNTSWPCTTSRLKSPDNMP